MSQVIYARVPDTVKDAVDMYAEERGTTLASAVVGLLERGLVATSDASSVEQLELRLATAQAQKAEADASLRSAERELQAYQALAERVGQVVGACPACGEPITGHSVLVTGHCASCRATLSDLLRLRSPQPAGDGQSGRGGISERDFLLLLGALGAVIGVAYVASKS